MLGCRSCNRTELGNGQGETPGFFVSTPSRLTVLAILHEHRDSEAWRGRL